MVVLVAISRRVSLLFAILLYYFVNFAICTSRDTYHYSYGYFWQNTVSQLYVATERKLSAFVFITKHIQQPESMGYTVYCKYM